jgi:hypothetical protein
MKTIIFTLALTLTASLAISRPQLPYLPPDYQVMAMQEEAFVNDIPFDTWMVGQTSVPDKVMMTLPDEEYVDDIPFSTEKVANKILFCRLLECMDEASVDDIPFNTEKVFNDIQLQECIAEYCDEDNVNDIPFNTRYLACCKQMMMKVMPSYVDEQAAEDICFNTKEIACKYLFNRMVEDYRQEEVVSDIPFEGDCWKYDAKKDILSYQCGATMQFNGFRVLNNYDFMIETERYMEEFGEKLRGLDQLTIDEPF